MPDVAFSLHEQVDFVLVNVETGDGIPRTAKFDHQWQPDITQANDADVCFVLFYQVDEHG